MALGANWKHVKEGDSLTISAGAWNAVQDMARQFYGDGGGIAEGKIGGTPQSSTVVTVSNSSGSDVAVGEVLQINDITPTINRSKQLTLDRYRYSPVFGCDTPTSSAALSLKPLVIALDPIRNGKNGRAVISGVACVKLNIVSSWHFRADYEANQKRLKTYPGGRFEILAKETGTGTDKLAWVLMNQNPYIHYYAKLIDSLTTSGSATGNLMKYGYQSSWSESSEQVTVYAPPLFSGTIASGKIIGCHWESAALRLEVDEKECG